LLASSAPPSPFETTSGFSLSDLTPKTEVPEVPLLEFASPSEPSRFSAARASVWRPLLAQRPPAVPAWDRLSWSSRSREHIDVGCPSSTHPGRKAGAGKVWVAKPPPEPSSGFLPLSTVLATLAARTNPLRSPSFAVAPRRFAALFHAARAPGVALQSFPFSRSRTRFRGPLLPCGFAFDRPTARHDPRVSRPLSPIAPTSRHGWPEGSPDWKAGTSVPWSR